MYPVLYPLLRQLELVYQIGGESQVMLVVPMMVHLTRNSSTYGSQYNPGSDGYHWYEEIQPPRPDAREFHRMVFRPRQVSGVGPSGVRRMSPTRKGGLSLLYVSDTQVMLLNHTS